MAGFHTKTFIKHDDYMTPKHAWEAVAEYIPQDKTIWEAFYGDGESGQYLTELGFNVIHEPVDFFKNDMGDIIVSNRAWKDKKIQIIIPRKRIHFNKLVDGETPENYKSSCNFDCFYYCYKMSLPQDIIWLE